MEAPTKGAGQPPTNGVNFPLTAMSGEPTSPFYAQYHNFPPIVNGGSIDRSNHPDVVHNTLQAAAFAVGHLNQTFKMGHLAASLPSHYDASQANFAPYQFLQHQNHQYYNAYPQLGYAEFTPNGGGWNFSLQNIYPPQQGQSQGLLPPFQPQPGLPPGKYQPYEHFPPPAVYHTHQAQMHNGYKNVHRENPAARQRHRASFRQISDTFGKTDPPYALPIPPHTRTDSQTAATVATSALEGNATVIPRGPPRKPRQSGHALWVGNLPLNVTVVDLKDHFSRGAINDIESLKLISKSNCGFVNYKSHASCVAALERFQDSVFHGTKLVCRLRRSSVAGLPSPKALQVAFTEEETAVHETKHSDRMKSAGDVSQGLLLGGDDCFFVLKSLTLEDLVTSVQTCAWSTQPHNEALLNTAYKSSRNVYLFFSVNTSGEYFGYARMASLIHRVTSRMEEEQANSAVNDKSVDSVDGVPEMQSPKGSVFSPGSTSPVLGALPAPRCTPTPRTRWAPRGHIIDDLARGTIFWEADVEEAEDENGKMTPVESGKDKIEGDGLVDGIESPSPTVDGTDLPYSQLATHPDTTNQVFGNAFDVEWISISRLPFRKTRGLRNPLNGNREVKIARDGTQIAADVGMRLMELFAES